MPAVGSGNAADVAEVAQPREIGGSGFGRHVRDDDGGARVTLDRDPEEVCSPFSTNGRGDLGSLRMFNQLPPAEVVAAIGATLRTAARNEGEPSAFERDQLMSAYSATRHLAAELAGYEPVLRDFTEQVAARVRVHGIPERDDELARLAGRLGCGGSPA